VPPQVDENGYGPRVPGLVISPYAKTGLIDHQQLSHDAYLKFIEDDFLAGSRLNPATDGRPDRRPSVREEAPTLGSLASDFEFNQAPRPPLLLPTNPEPGPASKPPGPNAPVVETSSATGVGQSTAVLHGSVDPEGASLSDCHFDYGTSTAYGLSVPCSSLPAAGSDPVGVSANLSGLTPNSTYHLRLVATNSGGTSRGTDRTFITAEQLPELGRCTKVPAEGVEKLHHGRYSDAGCTVASEAGNGEYEWAAGAGKRGFRLAGSASTLETAHLQLSCTGDKGNGEFLGARSASVRITFSGCESAAKVPCQSEGAARGEIVTSTLQGKLDFIKNHLNGTKMLISVGLSLGSAVPGTPAAVFECGAALGGFGPQVILQGAVIAAIVSEERMVATNTLKFTATGAKQKPESFEVGPTEVLQASLAGGIFEQAGLNLKSTLSGEETLEIKASP
jgi:hypothetical protein